MKSEKRKREIVLASRNKNKAKEIKDILKGQGVSILTLDNFRNLPEVEEDGETFEENAKKKALTIAKLTKRLTIADDSGLEVDALGGLPGVRSARFAGVGCTYADNNRKLLEMLEGFPKARRRARFLCTIAIADGAGLVGIASGQSIGHIGFVPKGRHGFGYDPVFVAPRCKKTFAELGPRIKNKISHRARALAKARAIIEGYLRRSAAVS